VHLLVSELYNSIIIISRKESCGTLTPNSLKF